MAYASSLDLTRLGNKTKTEVSRYSQAHNVCLNKSEGLDNGDTSYIQDIFKYHVAINTMNGLFQFVESIYIL